MTEGYAIPYLNGTVDSRIGKTSADPAPISVYESHPNLNDVIVVFISLAANSAVSGSATYTFTWTFFGEEQTRVLTMEAGNGTLVSNTFATSIDAGTQAQVQLQGAWSGGNGISVCCLCYTVAT